MRYPFRDFMIKRNCNEEYSDYHRYKPFLRTDFNKRCAYCNLSEERITTYFEIDHYIPKDAFKDIRPELETDYNNLMFACRKCNSEKSSMFKGDVTKKELENELFYDPTKVDYNSIFYRDDLCGIASDDPKGRNMIVLLKLYRPIHNLAGICEHMKASIEKLEAWMETIDEDSQEYLKYYNLKNEIKAYYSDLRDMFIANYNNKDFGIEEHIG